MYKISDNKNKYEQISICITVYFTFYSWWMISGHAVDNSKQVNFNAFAYYKGKIKTQLLRKL